MAYTYSTDKIIEALRSTNGLVSLAAKRLGCAPQTIYTRRDKVHAVAQVIDDCRSELVDYGELALRKAVVNGEPWAVGLVLKTLGKNRGYVERQEVTGADGGAIEMVWDDGCDVTTFASGPAGGVG